MFYIYIIYSKKGFNCVKVAIINYICSDCEKRDVCRNVNTLLKFDEDAKKQLGVDIKILHCKWFGTTADTASKNEDETETEEETEDETDSDE